jgi:hypothetical protein
MAKSMHVYTAQGMLEAEMIVNFLSAHGIQAMTSQESVGMTYGLNAGPLGEVLIYVTEEQENDAHQVLMEMEQGMYELPDEDENPNDDLVDYEDEFEDDEED